MNETPKDSRKMNNLRNRAEDFLQKSPSAIKKMPAKDLKGVKDLIPDKVYWSDETYDLFGWKPGEEVDFQRYINAVLPDDWRQIDYGNSVNPPRNAGNYVYGLQWEDVRKRSGGPWCTQIY